MIRRTYEPLKFLGRLFWVPLTVLPNTPIATRTHTWEDTGEHWGPTLVLRLPLTKYAVGLGVWLDAPESTIDIHEDDVEYDTYCAINGTVSRDAWQAAREKVASMGLDPEDEMEVMQSMGIFE